MPAPLSACFLAHVHEALRPRFAAQGDLEQALSQLLSAAQTRWPAVRIAAGDFIAFLARRLSPELPAERPLSELRASDLYLLLGWRLGDAAATQAFAEQHLSRARALLAARQTSPAVIDDVLQIVCQRAAAPESGEGRASLYSGTGDLSAWLCICAVRELQRQRRKLGREVPLGDDLLANRGATQASGELLYLRPLYQREFKESFEEAIHQLTSRDRNLLRYYVLDQLTIDQLGVMFRVHRVTAFRMVTRARQRLIDRTRALLMQRIHVTPEELDSVLRVLRSDMQLSLRRVLQGESERE